MEDLINHLLHSSTGKSWKKIGICSHHGINIPLSSIHSKKSCGIGEFYDLCPLIDWCQKLKIDVIQLLPLNTFENDPSPYNPSSSCALNILNLSLHALPFLNELPHLQQLIEEYTALPKPFRVDFHDVQFFKLKWLHAYFDAVGQKLIKSEEMQHFVSENTWVEPFALYESLKILLDKSSWRSWPANLQKPTEHEYTELVKQNESFISFAKTLQYLCYCQLKSVKAYANNRGVFIMGDIPILISAESADVWHNPDLFDTQLGAGAPPDAYNPEGQSWGFPLYRWDAMRKTQYSWWKRRLQYAANFYDIYRLDHVMGFFRIWAIPHGLPSIEGSYIPPDESLWESQGREMLELITHFTTMLPIAENLGTVPPIVPLVLQEKGICGTKVMRWERDLEKDGSLIPIQDYEPLSLTCISTHDLEPLQLWWKHFPQEAKALAQTKHWEYQSDLTFSQRKELLWDSHHTASLFHINLLQEYLALFPELVSSNPKQERINIPGHYLPTNWAYRYRPSVEEIAAHEELAKAMQAVISAPDIFLLHDDKPTVKPCET